MSCLCQVVFNELFFIGWYLIRCLCQVVFQIGVLQDDMTLCLLVIVSYCALQMAYDKTHQTCDVRPDSRAESLLQRQTSESHRSSSHTNRWVT